MVIKRFDSLRFVLATLVFIHHLQLYEGVGSLAVSVFFILGGFCSTLGYKEFVLSTNFNYRSYFLSKVIKFYPLHLLTLSGLVFFEWLSDSILFSAGRIRLLINALLLQSWIPLKDVYFSYNAVSWYLSDTFFYVAVFPFILKWICSHKHKVLPVIITVLILYFVLWSILPREFTHAIFYINPLIRLIDYVAGIIAGLFFLDMLNFSKYVSCSKNKMKLHILRILIIILLVCLTFLPSEVILHSLIYILPVCILLIITALLGGGGQWLCVKVGLN